MNEQPKPTHASPGRRRYTSLWLGIGLLLLGLVVWALLAKMPGSAPPGGETGQAPPLSASAEPKAAAGPGSEQNLPAKPVAGLQKQLEQVLAGIKEANQKKDLSQLLSYYSPNFPQLPQRAQSISKDWKVYNYPRMEFQIKDLRLINDHTAEVRVTWNVEVQNISTRKMRNLTKTYQTRFVKESGQWRIKALDKTE